MHDSQLTDWGRAPLTVPKAVKILALLIASPHYHRQAMAGWLVAIKHS